MFELKSDDLVRIERSPYINGHFYLKFKNREKSVMTLGFGYDEPFFEKNPLWLKPLTSIWSENNLGYTNFISSIDNVIFF